MPSEADPLLQVISRIHHVRLVTADPYFRVAFPYVCWIDAKAFRPLSAALLRYRGPFLWKTFVILPRRCLVVEPNIQRGEAPFVMNEVASASTLREAARLANRLERFGIDTPWRSSPVIEVPEFKSRVLAEMNQVAAFIEKDLNLVSKPSKGVDFSEESLELPLIEDHAGPGNGAVLVADPVRYAKEKSATSPLDRAIHYWITEEEAKALWAEILSKREASKEQKGDTEWPLLAQVAATEYESLVILPSNVMDLNREAGQLRSWTNRVDLRDALERISSVCRSAQSYGLGIYVAAIQN